MKKALILITLLASSIVYGEQFEYTSSARFNIVYDGDTFPTIAEAEDHAHKKAYSRAKRKCEKNKPANTLCVKSITLSKKETQYATYSYGSASRFDHGHVHAKVVFVYKTRSKSKDGNCSIVVDPYEIVKPASKEAIEHKMFTDWVRYEDIKKNEIEYYYDQLEFQCEKEGFHSCDVFNRVYYRGNHENLKVRGVKYQYTPAQKKLRSKDEMKRHECAKINKCMNEAIERNDLKKVDLYLKIFQTRKCD